MKTTEAFSPTLAKILLSIASVLGTLGGWAVLSSASAPARAAPPPPARAPEKATPAQPATKGARALRRVDVPSSAPVTFTRSSR